MGLHISTLEIVPKEIENIDYFLYLLDYGWESPIRDSLFQNFEEIAKKAERTKSLVLKGTSQHFEDEVFSYHNINGIRGDQVLPAILITKTNPHDFRQHNIGHRAARKGKDSFKFILIPLNEVCQSPKDVAKLIADIFIDISEKKDLTKFKIQTERKKGFGRAIVDSIILEPNFYGIGFSFKNLTSFFKPKS